MITIKQTGNFHINDIKKDVANIFEKNGQEIGKEAVSFFKKSFSIKGFMDKTLHKWAPQKYPEKNPLMIKTGSLERSIRVGTVNKNEIEIISDGLDYNEAQNEKREFIGNSYELESKIGKMISGFLTKISNKYK